MDKTVIKFVKSTRCSIEDDELSESEQIRLKYLFDDCISSIVKVRNKEIMPSFIICNTYNKYSVVMPVRVKKDKFKYYVLYDYHLTKINRFFDAIYLDKTDSAHDIWKLSYELFAEEALLENDKVLGMYYALNKTALGSFEANVNEQNNLDFIVKIQERYIVGHELGHWIYKMSENKSSENIFNITFDENWNKFLDDIQILLSELYEEYQKRFESKEYVEILHEQVTTVNENNEIQEECFADAIAYAMIFSYVDCNYLNDLEQKLLAGKALFLQMMNLQLLAMQKMTVSDESFEVSVSIRLTFLRNYSRLYFEGYEKCFDKMLEETVIRYEERITNLMLECFYELENRGDNIYNTLINEEDLLNMSKVLKIENL